MKLATYLSRSESRTAVINHEEQYLVDVTGLGSVIDILASASLRKQAAQLAQTGARVPLKRARLAVPFTPRNVIAIGLNYADHAAESNSPIPNKPVVFAKLSNTVVGPGATVTWHADVTDSMDYEAELGVVIGRKCSRVSVADALKHVGGYVCANDLSARDLQRGDDKGQWVLGKSLDASCPIGPWVTTSDEIRDPQSLQVKCILNGQVMQNSNTSQMIFSVATLVSHLSKTMTLMPGDLIVTGTPPGVGMGRNPKLWLKNGDEVVIEIEKIGALRNIMRVLP